MKNKKINNNIYNYGIFIFFIWFFLSLYLYIDSLTGFFLWKYGLEIPLSQLWKGVILILALTWSLFFSRSLFCFLIVLIIFLLSGPIVRLFQDGIGAGFVESCIMALKALMPAIIIGYCNQAQFDHPEFVSRGAPRVLWLCVGALVLNILLGIFGLGFTAYGTGETGGIGVVGFFPAGNEVSATFAILAGFVLMRGWQAQRRFYLLIALMVVGCGFLIATKAAIGAAILLSFCIPVAYRRGAWMKISPAMLFLLLVALGLLTLAAIELWAVLELVGLSDRILYIYENQGVIGILFSGRDVTINSIFSNLYENLDLTKVFFGLGPTFLNQASQKITAEVDPVDLYLWFGLPGVIYGFLFLLIVTYISMKAYSDGANRHGPGVLVINVTLVGISIFAGHVVFGGMAGIVWAVLNALVILESRNIRGPKHVA